MKVFAVFFTTPIFYRQEGRHGNISDNGAPLFYLCQFIIITFCLYCFIILKYHFYFGHKFSNSAMNFHFQLDSSFCSYLSFERTLVNKYWKNYSIYDSDVFKISRILVIMCVSGSLSYT